MSTTTATMTSSASADPRLFWERLWRQSGINFVLFFVIAYAVGGLQPQVGAPSDVLVAFYHGARVRILIAAVFAGMSVLNLLWFAAAIRSTLADAGQDGWGGAVTASSTAVGGLVLAFVALVTAASTVADPLLTAGLNSLAWTSGVMSSFPRAMLIMSGTFGLWRSGRISNQGFGAGVAALVLVLLGGTTWLGNGFWAPDGAYARFVSPAISLVWVMAVSRVLLTRAPATRAAW